MNFAFEPGKDPDAAQAEALQRIATQLERIADGDNDTRDTARTCRSSLKSVIDKEGENAD